MESPTPPKKRKGVSGAIPPPKKKERISFFSSPLRDPGEIERAGTCRASKRQTNTPSLYTGEHEPYQVDTPRSTRQAKVLNRISLPTSKSSRAKSYIDMPPAPDISFFIYAGYPDKSISTNMLPFEELNNDELNLWLIDLYSRQDIALYYLIIIRDG